MAEYKIFPFLVFMNCNSKKAFIWPIFNLGSRENDQNILLNTIGFDTARSGRRDVPSRCANEVGILQCLGLKKFKIICFPTKVDWDAIH